MVVMDTVDALQVCRWYASRPFKSLVGGEVEATVHPVLELHQQHLGERYSKLQIFLAPAATELLQRGARA